VSEDDLAEPDGSGRSEEPGHSDETEEPGHSDETEEPGHSDETEEPSHSDETEEPSHSDETERPPGSDGFDGLDGSDGGSGDWFEAESVGVDTERRGEVGAGDWFDAEFDDGSAGGGSLFEEDFAAAFAEADVPGLGDDGPGLGFETAGEPEFDGEPDSELPRFDLGIEGLDGMIHGGIPERSLMVAIGGAGTGKTTFGLQFLTHGLENGERAVFLSLEESHERVVNSATEKGYAFERYLEEGRLAVVDLDAIEMANSLTSMGSELPRLIEEFGASRLVLDSVSLLEMMYDERSKRRMEIYEFTRQLKEAGISILFTSEVSQSNPYASRHGIIEYLADAVFVLQYVRPDDFRETRLALEIQKIRDANHSRDKKPYEITDEGISVYHQANLF